jgi:hypothetical protein
MTVGAVTTAVPLCAGTASRAPAQTTEVPLAAGSLFRFSLAAIAFTVTRRAGNVAVVVAGAHLGSPGGGSMRYRIDRTWVLVSVVAALASASCGSTSTLGSRSPVTSPASSSPSPFAADHVAKRACQVVTGAQIASMIGSAPNLFPPQGRTVRAPHAARTASSCLFGDADKTSTSPFAPGFSVFVDLVVFRSAFTARSYFNAAAALQRSKGDRLAPLVGVGDQAIMSTARAPHSVTVHDLLIRRGNHFAEVTDILVPGKNVPPFAASRFRHLATQAAGSL